MSIQIDKRRKVYFINYAITLPNGDIKRINIYNKDWKIANIGKKQMKAIEEEEIEKDKAKRKLTFVPNGLKDDVESVLKIYEVDLHARLKNQTAHSKIMTLKKYLPNHFKLSKPMVDAFTKESCESFKDYVVSLKMSVKRKNVILTYLKELIQFGAEREFLTFELQKQLEVRLKNITSDTEMVKERDTRFWDIEQITKFFATFKEEDHDYKWKYLFKFAFFSGCRIGEIEAIKWSDVNFNENYISIYKSIDKTGTLVSTKNKASNDKVFFTDAYMQELKEFKEKMYATDDDYIFFNHKYFSRTTAKRIMDTHADMANLPRLNLHGWRHSACTHMLSNGVSIQAVSKHLRHSSIKITMDVYSHLTQKDKKDAVKVFEFAF